MPVSPVAPRRTFCLGILGDIDDECSWRIVSLASDDESAITSKFAGTSLNIPCLTLKIY